METATGQNGLEKRSRLRLIGVATRGFCMGCADVIPGVSGGTMAFILGIYEELIVSIRNLARAPFLKAVFSGKFARAWREGNLAFLLAVLIGIGLAIVSLARGLAWMLENRPIMIWSFFFGLILGSVFTVSRRVGRWSFTRFLALGLATASAYILVFLVPLQTPETWWFLFLSGFLAICAMILPGISGAFILVLLGKYDYVLRAVNQRQFGIILIVGIGAVAGLISFAQVLSWLFKRYHDLTVATLIGFMLGSLRRIWPWKETLEWIRDRHGELVPALQRNILPALRVDDAFNTEILVALGLGLAGLIAVILLEKLANQGTPTNQ